MFKKFCTALSIIFMLGTITSSMNLYVNASENNVTEYKQYNDNLANTKKINFKDILNDLGNNDTHYLYIGHKECKYCRSFVPTLNKFINETHNKFEYLNLDNTSKNDIFNILNIMHSSNINSELKLPVIVKINNGKFVKVIPGHFIDYKDLNNLVN